MKSFRRVGNVIWLLPAVRLARSKVLTPAAALVTLVFVTIALPAFLSPARAGEIFRDDFSSPDGSLIGTTADVGGTWTQNGATDTKAMQIANGTVPLVNTGLDLYGVLRQRRRDFHGERGSAHETRRNH